MSPSRCRMSAQEFRELALSLPETAEVGHMGHPDFRVGGKIFATLGPGEAWGMAKLTPDEQAVFVRTEPAAFQPVNGAWGRKGATVVRLENATEPSVRQALLAAWRNTAPKSLVTQFDDATKEQAAPVREPIKRKPRKK